MFFEIKQTLKGGKKKKKDTLRMAIEFHIPSSCDVEEPKRSATKVKSFHWEGWDGIFFLLKKNNKQPKHPEESAHLAANVTMLFALLVV